MGVTLKKCYGDGHTQLPHMANLELFGSDVTREDGKALYCRPCLASRQRHWKKAHPDKVRANKREYRKNKKLKAQAAGD